MNVELLYGGNHVWQLVSGLLSAYCETNGAIANSELDLVQQRMHEVCAEYSSAFRSIRDDLDDGSMSIDDVGRFLSERRRDFERERDAARVVAIKLRAIRGKPSSNKSRAGIVRYCRAIDRFLTSAYNYQERGQATYLNILLAAERESAIRVVTDGMLELKRESTPGENVPFDMRPPNLLDDGDKVYKRMDYFRAVISAIVEYRLPTSIASVNRYYAEIRLRLV